MLRVRNAIDDHLQIKYAYIRTSWLKCALPPTLTLFSVKQLYSKISIHAAEARDRGKWLAS